jgi:DNA processing protein
MDMAGAAQRRYYSDAEMPPRTRYNAPRDTVAITLKALMAATGRNAMEERNYDLLRSARDAGGRDDVRVFYAGDIHLLEKRCVSIVGTRDVSDAGWIRASRLAKELVHAGVAVVSGLARGVDAAAMTSAIEHGGRTVGVIGTPLNKAYPAENAALQETVWRKHLLMSPFAPGEPIFKSNFPKRNRVMAAISDATVIIEASDTSGTLHQAAECQRLGRWLFIAKSVADNPSLKWPKSFLGQPKTAVLEKTENILGALEDECAD